MCNGVPDLFEVAEATVRLTGPFSRGESPTLPILAGQITDLRWSFWSESGPVSTVHGQDADKSECGVAVSSLRRVWLNVPSLTFKSDARQRRLFGIVDPSASRDVRLRRWLLRRAALAKGLQWTPVDIRTVQFSALPRPEPGDMVFGFTRNTNHVERLMLRPWVGSFYETFEAGLRFPDASEWTTIHAAHGITMPITCHGLSTEKRELESIVDVLGGFPIVIKEEALSQGRGVTLVRNFDELRNAALNQRKPAVTLARQYIDTNRSTRAIVISNDVVFSYEYEAPAGEFRSNAGLLPSVTVRACDDDARRIAVKAVHVLGLTCGGVDLLQDRQGSWLLLEVNFPFNFATPDVMLNANVTGALVESLARSAEQRLNCT
jgi:hypothetical protein